MLPAHQQYRLKFVHQLQTQLGLNDRQVAVILQFERPPYPLTNVPSVLKEHYRDKTSTEFRSSKGVTGLVQFNINAAPYRWYADYTTSGLF